MSSIFITGISGYIGGRLLERLKCLSLDRIYCLYRNTSDINCSLKNANEFIPVQGSVEDVNTYSHYLPQCDTVVHLAAQTGKASREEYFKVNSIGTELLVSQCQKMGVKKILYVSTIAVNYQNKEHYYYAQSKERGELAVLESGINYTIVRPTIVIGENSPNWKGLESLAKAPVIPLFGRINTQIQPIYVDDLIANLIHILDNDKFDNFIIELGGPDRITFEAFLRNIHYEHYGKNAVVLKLPHIMLQNALSFIEKFNITKLPITAGQLSVFNNDSTAQPNSLLSKNVAKMKGANEMVKLLVNLEKSRVHSLTLEKECKVYATYLVGQEPTDYIVRKYSNAHKYTALLDSRNAAAFDQFLLNYSVNHPILMHMMDSYTALFYKKAMLRSKLVLMTAIMESSAPTYIAFETSDSSNIITIGIKLSARMIRFVLSLLGSIIIFSPIRLGYSLIPRQIAERKIS